jgi:uncharacterized protein YbjT (DUF2867 family)
MNTNPGTEVFLTGATGFLGSRLAGELIRRGHRVRGLVRPGSESRLVDGGEATLGNALDATSYQSHVAPANTFVHLVGVAHPSPKKAAEFRTIDLKSIQEAVKAARHAGVRHFTYLSVAQPAPMMLEYQAVRAEGERLIRESGILATFVRPWYVLGPGRRWPLFLTPFYAIARVIPATREGAVRLGLVTIDQMTRTLAWVVENVSEVFESSTLQRFGKVETLIGIRSL